MSEQTNKIEQVIEIDPERLRVVEISNITGLTFVTGIKGNQIRITSHSRGGKLFEPNVQIKQGGREVEITALPAGMMNFKMGKEGRVYIGGFGEDYDSPEGQGPNFDYSSFDLREPQPWEYPDTEEGRETYRDKREKYRAERDRLREIHNQRREQAREERRRQREKTREEIRQGKEEFQRGEKSGFWGFNFENLGDIARSVGRIVADSLGNETDLYIEIPATSDLEVKTTSGEVIVRNILGFCRIDNTSGAVKLSELGGGAQVKAVSGLVEGQDLSGRLTMKLVSGRAVLRKCQLSGLDLTSSSSDIRVETAIISEGDAGDYRINTSSGKVNFLIMPTPHPAVSVDCRTLSGRIRIAPELGRTESRNRPGQSQARLELNGGGQKVSINTMSGNINVGFWDSNTSEQQDYDGFGSWPTPPAPPVPPVPSQDAVPPVPPVPPIPMNFGDVGKNWEVKMEVEMDSKESGFQQDVEEVNVERRVYEESETQPEVSRPPLNKTDRQLALLQAVERGEISVEEAMLRLNELAED